MIRSVLSLLCCLLRVRIPNPFCDGHTDETRQRAKALLSQLQESLGLIDKLKNAIERKHACFDYRCGEVQKRTTPTQSVRFLLWINRNAEVLARVVPNFPPKQEFAKASACDIDDIVPLGKEQ
jgi:hypothetical protein